VRFIELRKTFGFIGERHLGRASLSRLQQNFRQNILLNVHLQRIEAIEPGPAPLLKLVVIAVSVLQVWGLIRPALRVSNLEINFNNERHLFMKLFFSDSFVLLFDGFFEILGKL